MKGNRLRKTIVLVLSVLVSEVVVGQNERIAAGDDCLSVESPVDSVQQPDTMRVESLPMSEAAARKPMAFAPEDSVKLQLELSAPDFTFKPTIFDMPYSRSTNMPNLKKLGYNTLGLYTAGFVALGLLELLPEDATAWNKEELRKTPFFERWWLHVKQGPVWDKDKWYFNYVLHPYGGAAYYMGARGQGCNMLYSFLYCFGVSTLFWEYGIEAFNEVPSYQDLIITPIVGSAIGEAFYVLKRHIVSNGYTLFGSLLFGNIVVYIIDPVNEVLGHIYGNDVRRNVEFGFTPMLGRERGVQASLRLTF